MTTYNVPVLSLVSAPLVNAILKFDGTNWVPDTTVKSQILVLESEMSAVQGAGGGWTNGPSIASIHSATQSRVLVLESEVSAVQGLATAVDSQLLIIESECAALRSSEASQASVQSVAKSRILVLESEMSAIQQIGAFPSNIFRVTKDDAQSLPASVWTKVEFNDEVFDTGGNYDSVTNYRYTAPATGYYLFTATVSVTATLLIETVEYVAFYKNGVSYAEGNKAAGKTPGEAVCVTTIIELTANDYVEVWVLTEKAAAIDTAAKRSHFSGCRIA